MRSHNFVPFETALNTVLRITKRLTSLSGFAAPTKSAHCSTKSAMRSHNIPHVHPPFPSMPLGLCLSRGTAIPWSTSIRKPSNLSSKIHHQSIEQPWDPLSGGGQKNLAWYGDPGGGLSTNGGGSICKKSSLTWEGSTRGVVPQRSYSSLVWSRWAAIPLAKKAR